MPLCLCSILGTFLIALSLAAPALAEQGTSKGDDASDVSASAKKSKKGSKGAKRSKKKADKDEAKDEDAEAEASDEKADKKSDKGKDDDKKSDTETAEAAPAEEAAPEPDAWEAPPEEKEAPPPSAVLAKENEEVAGDGRAISMGLLLGYGFKTDRRARYFAGDPYTLGAGIRGGYSFDFQLYIGAYFVYYLGSGTTGDSAFVADPTRTIHVNYMHFGAEAGYDLWFGPGATLMVPMEEWFLGGDLRASIVTGDGVSNVLLAATGGLRF